jgi:CBS domain-containing protein
MPLAEQNLTLAVKYLIKRAPVFVDADATVGDAAKAMQRAQIGSVLVADDPPGIITDRDLRGRVLAAGEGSTTPAQRVMSRPLKTLDSEAPVVDALRLMLDENIHHLVLVEEGQIVGLVSASDLLHFQASSPFFLQRTLEDLEDSGVVVHYAREVAAIVESLFRGGLSATEIGRIVSSLNDSLVKRLVRIAQRKLGPTPTDFAWIVFGSEGRFEQTLLTDQDNALIYGDASESAHGYFAALAQQVVDGLIQVGFPPCAGGFMATRWCKPLAEWCELFTAWIRTPQPQALLDAATFFDFRVAAGGLSLTPLETIVASAREEKVFIAQLVNDALGFGPPLGFLGRLRAERGRIDLKKSGLLPIVGLARAAALASGSRERSTLGRLEAAGKAGTILSPGDTSPLAEIFQFLLFLRLRRQLAALETNQPLDHCVHVSTLSTLEHRRLKDGFVMLKRIQAGIRATLPIGRMG